MRPKRVPAQQFQTQSLVEMVVLDEPHDLVSARRQFSGNLDKDTNWSGKRTYPTGKLRNPCRCRIFVRGGRTRRKRVVGSEARIAADMADALVNRLFAVGLDLHRALESTTGADARARLEQAIAGLDDTIQMIRLAATGLEPPENAPA